MTGLPSLALTGTITVAASTANWPQLHYGPDRTGAQPSESRLGTGDVANLRQVRTYQTIAGLGTEPIVSNGILYVVHGGLYAFDATGSLNCASVSAGCTPIWKATTGEVEGMTVGDGKVFLTEQSPSSTSGVIAFDAAGLTNCTGGAPRVCHPLWLTSHLTTSGPPFTVGFGAPVIANHVLYVPGYTDGLPLAQGGAYVAAFDPAGVKSCKGAICTPMWTTIGAPASSPANTGSPSVAGGALYIDYGGSLFAFDAAGKQKCAVATKVCSPLWSAATPGAGSYGAPAVAGNKVYVGLFNSTLFTFDASGKTNCTTAASVTTCTPLWTTATTSGGTGGSPAVANGVVYAALENGTLSAFDAAGSTKCTGPVTARVCQPLWTGSGVAYNSSPAVANGVVYVAGSDGETEAFSAAGAQHCTTTSTAKTCTPLWASGLTTGGNGGSPAIVNGVVYVTVFGTIYAYSL